jgi:hypothetical protein
MTVKRNHLMSDASSGAEYLLHELSSVANVTGMICNRGSIIINILLLLKRKTSRPRGRFAETSDATKQ